MYNVIYNKVSFYKHFDIPKLKKASLSGEGCFQPGARSWKGGCIWLCPNFVQACMENLLDGFASTCILIPGCWDGQLTPWVLPFIWQVKHPVLRFCMHAWHADFANFCVYVMRALKWLKCWDRHCDGYFVTLFVVFSLAIAPIGSYIGLRKEICTVCPLHFSIWQLCLSCFTLQTKAMPSVVSKTK